jgi:two-component system, NarL family, response regulator NreC
MPARLHLASMSESAESSPRVDSPITVILADDHPGLRRSLRLLLDGEQDVDVIAEASDLSTLVHQVHGHLPRVLVLGLPNKSSVETVSRLRAQVPATEIVVMTMQESPLFARQAIDAGAIGFMLKDRADSELLTAIRCAASGDEYVSARVASGLEALRWAVGDDGLSPRETEVLRLIALGHTSAEIATKLRLSRRTVDTHRARIHRKLGLTTRAELVQFALRHGLIGT